MRFQCTNSDECLHGLRGSPHHLARTSGVGGGSALQLVRLTAAWRCNPPLIPARQGWLCGVSLGVPSASPRPMKPVTPHPTGATIYPAIIVPSASPRPMKPPPTTAADLAPV